MKRIVLIVLLMFSFAFNINAQNIKREGKTFSKVSVEKQSVETKTEFKYQDKNISYDIYISKNGSAYIYRTSKKTGNKYKYYLGEEISKEICKELGIEYKGNSK